MAMRRFAAAATTSTRAITAAKATPAHHHQRVAGCSLVPVVQLRKTASNWRPNFVHTNHHHRHHSITSTPTSEVAAKKLEHSKRRNQEILRLGKNNDWKGILALYKETLFREHRYSNVNYATMMNQLGRILNNHDDDAAELIRPLLDDLWKIFNTRGLEWMGVRETSNIVYAIGKMKLRTESADRIVEFVANKENATTLVETGEPQSVANLCWGLAKLGRSDIASTVFQELEKHVDKFVAKGSAQEIANAAWSSAKLGIQSPKLFAGIENHADRIVATGESINVAIHAWSCAKLGVRSPKLFAEIEQRADKFVAEAKPREIRALLLAFSKLGVDSTRLLSTIEKQQAMKIDKRAIPQQSGKTAEKKQEIARNQQIIKLAKNGDWRDILNFYEESTRQGYQYSNVNYATTMNQLGKIQNVDLGDASIIRFIDDVWDILDTKGMEWMGIRETANIVHAIARMHIETDSARRIVEFVASEENATMLVESGTPQELANVCWGLAKLGRSDIASPLFQEVEKNANKIVVEGDAQNIANTAWACATLGVQSPKLFALIDKHADKIFVEGRPRRPQTVSNTAWSCATLGVQSPDFFAKIEKDASKLVTEARPEEIASMAWACAMMVVKSPSLFAEIEKQASRLVVEGSAQDITNTLWGFIISSTFEGEYKHVILFLWEKAMKHGTAEFTEEALGQLAQIHAFSEVSDGISLPKPPAELLERIRSACVSRLTESSSQKEVSSLLTELGLHIEDDASPSSQLELLDNLLTIDIALPEHMLAIEFDELSQFLRSVETGELIRNENGLTQTKRHFLQKFGWKVVNIDFRDWDAAETKEAKLSFLRNELEKVGIRV